jgi:hypothetical protein
MKDPEFIELLNLYIDHEISAEDSVRLEAEVVSNREHRKLYRQYCRMHRACCFLAEESRAETPEVEPVVARPGWRARSFAAIYATGLMAAACFLFLAVVRFHRPDRVNLAAPEAVAVAVASPAPARSQLHAVVDLRDLTLSGENGGSASLLSSDQSQLFAWMKQLQIAPVQLPQIDQAFNQAPELLGSGNRAERSPGGLQTPTEMVGFRFQR